MGMDQGRDILRESEMPEQKTTGEADPQEALSAEDAPVAEDAPAEEDVTAETEAEAEPEPEPILPIILELVLSKDRLIAYIRVREHPTPEQSITVQEVMDFLEQKEITYGVIHDSVTDFCENRKFFTDLIVARGTAPIPEKDGELTYNFRVGEGIQLTEREDGTVDYRNLGLVQNVSKGDTLCVLTPPHGGEDGVDVYGAAVPFPKGKRPAFRSGAETVVSEDGLSLLAAIDGCVEMRGARVLVSNVFQVPGDVDASTGNIQFVGVVRVNGDVLEGFTVEAGGDVIVRGMVEGASITAGGNLSIGEGMNGMGMGRLKVGGDIVSKFLENVTAEAGGDIRTDTAINSRLKAGGSVVVRGIKGTLIGGSCHAGKMIYANYIGTPRFGGTTLSIQNSELNLLLAGNSAGELQQMRDDFQTATVRLEKLHNTIAELTKAMGPDDTEGREKLRTAVLQKSKTANKLAALTAKMKECDNSENRCRAYKVVATKSLYPGTKLTISSHTMLVTDTYDSTKFFAEPDGISTAPLTPADKI